MKLTYNQPELNTKPFEGSLEGVPITAALKWDHSEKDFVYFFAGRHLCRQEISPTNWVPMCNITDIADWLSCSGSNTADEDGSSATLVILLLLAFVIFVVISLIVFLWIDNEKPKSEPNPQQNASNASKLSNIRSGLK